MEMMNTIFELIFAIVVTATAAWRLSYFTHMNITLELFSFTECNSLTFSRVSSLASIARSSHSMSFYPECLHILNQ